jgi:hypothetical protein
VNAENALTTFSIANDIAKYFAIIPAMFAAVYPSLDQLNIMRPETAILSAVSSTRAQPQMARVAKARGISVAALRPIVNAHICGRTLGFLGAPTVNVLALNLDLDSSYPCRPR